jgi:GMP synthase-like glutamine amidotransferase
VRVLVLQHGPLDGPGYLGDALERRGAALTVVRLDLGQPIPPASARDALLVLGGETNVYQEAEHPWLVEEDRAIRAAVADGAPVLGVCLGGQLLAKALGAPVQLGGATEVGLISVALTPAGRVDPLFAGLPGELEVVAWHDDTFAIPAGATALASSSGCPNQAFRFGAHAYGLQFHPEVSPAMLAEWTSAATGDRPVDWSAFRRQVESRAEALRAQAERLAANFLRASAPDRPPAAR